MILRDPEFLDRFYDVPADLFDTAVTAKQLCATSQPLVQLLFDLARSSDRPIQMDFGF